MFSSSNLKHSVLPINICAHRRQYTIHNFSLLIYKTFKMFSFCNLKHLVSPINIFLHGKVFNCAYQRQYSIQKSPYDTYGSNTAIVSWYLAEEIFPKHSRFLQFFILCLVWFQYFCPIRNPNFATAWPFLLLLIVTPTAIYRKSGGRGGCQARGANNLWSGEKIPGNRDHKSWGGGGAYKFLFWDGLV